MSRPFRRRRLERWLRRSERLDPSPLLGLSQEDGEELLFEAKRRLEAGAIDDAGWLFGLHLACFGLGADALIGTGACHQAHGDFLAAMEAYTAALEHRPDDPFAWANLTECALLLDRPQGIRAALNGLEAVDRSGLAPDLRDRIDRLDAMARERLLGVEAPAEPGQPLYAVEPGLSVEEFADVLNRSGLAERRPMDEPQTLRGMLANAGVIVTARVEGRLVGVSRAITDFAYCTYLSDLAVDRECQKRGIGKALIRRTHEEAGLQTTLILLAAPLARSYYPHVGMTAHDSCWIIPRQTPSP